MIDEKESFDITFKSKYLEQKLIYGKPPFLKDFLIKSC